MAECPLTWRSSEPSSPSTTPAHRRGAGRRRRADRRGRRPGRRRELGSARTPRCVDTRRRLRDARFRRGARASADGGDRAVGPDGRHPAGHDADADDVVAAIRAEVAAPRRRRAPTSTAGIRCCRTGLPEPTLAWLDGLAPDTPLVIIHNSGPQGVLQLRGRRATPGLTRDTPDPKGAQLRPRRRRRTGRHRRGDRRGVPADRRRHRPGDYPAMLLAECARLNRGRADHLLGDGVRPDVPADARRSCTTT